MCHPAAAKLSCHEPVRPIAEAPAAAIAGRKFCSSFSVTFVNTENGSETTVPAKPGQTILDCAHSNNIDIEGACGGECACSTCHIYLDQEVFDRMEAPDDDEADMLDLAANVTDLSRLGCQVKLQKDKDNGIKIKIPAGAVNLLS